MQDLLPLQPAPPPNAPTIVREEWCKQAVRHALKAPQEGDIPDDQRETHRWETEFETAMLDPPEYEANLREEVTRRLM